MRTRNVKGRLAASTAAVALVATAGCSTTGGSDDAQSAAPAATMESIDGILADYDKRNNAAIKAARPPKYGHTGWRRADAGVALNFDVYSTAFSEVTDDKSKGKPLTSHADRVWAGTTDTSPRWVVVQDTGSGDGNRSPNKGEAYIDLFVQKKQDATWKKAAAVAVKTKDMPAPATGDPVPTDTKAAEKVAQQIADFWENGNHEKTATIQFKSMKQSLEAVDPQGTYLQDPVFKAKPFDRSWAKSTRMVPAEGGVLAFTGYEMTATMAAKPNMRVNLGGDEAAFRTQPQGGVGLTLNATTLTFLPDKGKPEVIGANVREIVSKWPKAARN